MPATPAWMSDDAAAYDALRDVAAVLVGRALAAGDTARAAAIGRSLGPADAFDRAALDSITVDLVSRLSEGGDQS